MPKFVLIEHSLKHLGGHYYTYAYGVLQVAEAAGYRPVLVTHREFRERHAVPNHWDVHAFYPDKSRWTLAPDAARGPFRVLRDWFTNRSRDRTRYKLAKRFAAATAELFRRIPLETGDHVFVTTASDADLLGLAMFLEQDAATRCATWHVQFHHPLFNGREPDIAKQPEVVQQARQAFQDALGRIPDHRVRLYCTTPQLTRQYQHLGAGTFSCLPYPIHPLFRGPKERAATQPIRIACLGHTRMEKGYDQLPHVIRTLWPRYLSTGRAELMLQTRRTKLRKKLAQLVRDLGGATDSTAIAYAPFPLDLPDYAKLVGSADINLLLYDSTRYYSRCSGVLLESLIAGVPVIVPAGGWLAQQIDEPNQLYLETVATDADPRIALGDVTFPHTGTVTHSAIPPGTKQVLVEFYWRAPQAPGTYARITLRQRNALGESREFASIVGARPEGITRALFDLAPGSDQVELLWENAYGDERIELGDTRLIALRARHPLGSVGLTAARPQQSPQLVEEILENLEHYQRASRTMCTRYAAHYSAEAVVAICTGQAPNSSAQASAINTLEE
jgi:glycosyltransferase involved in cell wall biosynthesis